MWLTSHDVGVAVAKQDKPHTITNSAQPFLGALLALSEWTQDLGLEASDSPWKTLLTGHLASFCFQVPQTLPPTEA